MNIRLLLFLLSIALCNNQAIFAQTKMEKIKHIQDVFKTTNKIAGFKIIELENEEFLEEMPDGGGELKGFFKNDSLFKISEWIGLSYGTIETDYYFEKENLVFSYVREKYFPFTDSTINSTALILKFEGRYYYDRGKIIAQKNSGSGMWGNTLDDSNPILDNSGKYLKLLKLRLK